MLFIRRRLLHANSAMTAVICAIAILTLNATIYCQDNLKCGDQVLIDLQNGTTLTGKLVANNGRTLSIEYNYYGRYGLDTVSLNQVSAAFLVKNKTGKGILLGALAGMFLGTTVAVVTVDHSLNDALRDFGIFLGGTVLGGVVGGLVGKNSYSYHQIELGILPLCGQKEASEYRLSANEILLKLQSGSVVAGKLISNDGKSLSIRSDRFGVQKVPLSDVESAYRGHKKSGSGLVVGSLLGAGAGVAIGIAVNSGNRKHGVSQSGNSEQISTILIAGASGTVVGGLLGYLIKGSSHRLRETKVEALPLSISPSGNLIPLEIRLSMSF